VFLEAIRSLVWAREKGEYALKNYSQIKAVYQPLENPAWR